MTENKGDLISREALKETIIKICGKCSNNITEYDENKVPNGNCAIWHILNMIDNAPTVEIPVARWDCYCEGQKVGYEKALSERPQGVCKDCDNCEDKALSYSIGFQDGYLLGGFQLTELRRWLIAQGYSEGTVEDKIEDFGRFVKRIREDEG